MSFAFRMCELRMRGIRISDSLRDSFGSTDYGWGVRITNSLRGHIGSTNYEFFEEPQQAGIYELRMILLK
jgi:hypothetical protein